MSILLPLFITPFCVAVRGKAMLKILALVSPYSEKPKVRYVSEFNLGYFTKMNNNVVTPFLPILGWLSGVKPHLKCSHWSFHIRRTL